MITYEYKCIVCGNIQEIQKDKYRPDENYLQLLCPICQVGMQHKRIISKSNVIFKGNGFYQTDYKQQTGGENDGN